MKELRLIIFVALSVFFLPNQASAQCTPDTTLTDVGLYPDSVLGYVGAPFSDTLQAVLPTDTTISSLTFYFCNYKILGTTPSLDTLGLTIECDQPDCDYTVDHTVPGGVNWGCIIISGTPLIEVDTIMVNIESNIGSLVGGDCVSSTPLPISLPFNLKIRDTTTSSIFKDLNREKLQFSLFPNPTESTTQLQFNMPVRGNVDIEVYNTLGQKVSTVFSGIALGQQNLEINGNQLNDGLYFVRMNINNGEKVITERLIIN